MSSREPSLDRSGSISMKWDMTGAETAQSFPWVIDRVMQRGTIAMNIVYREDVRLKKTVWRNRRSAISKWKRKTSVWAYKAKTGETNDFDLPTRRKGISSMAVLHSWRTSYLSRLYGSRAGKCEVISFIRCRDWVLSHRPFCGHRAMQFCRGGRVYWKECRGNKLDTIDRDYFNTYRVRGRVNVRRGG